MNDDNVEKYCPADISVKEIDFERLYNTYYRLLCRFVKEKGSRQEDAENIVSDFSIEDNGNPTCMDGGCGKSSCSYKGEITIEGVTKHYNNFVSCEDAWACCYTTAYCFPKNQCSSW